MNYQYQELKMQECLNDYKTPAGFRSSYKGAPMSIYEHVKYYIDFTKYYVVFRGPRPRFGQCSTLKRDARAFDVYARDARKTKDLRIEKEAFERGVRWANNRSH